MVKHFECVIKHIQILLFISSVWRICPIAVIELIAHASISLFGYPSAREAAGTLHLYDGYHSCTDPINVSDDGLEAGATIGASSVPVVPFHPIYLLISLFQVFVIA